MIKSFMPRSLLVLMFAITLGIMPAASHDGPGRHIGSGHLDRSDLPTCTAGAVLSRVSEKAAFNGQAPYQQPVTIARYDRIHQTRHIGSFGPGTRERRWCRARVHLVTGNSHTVFYLIESHASFVGVSYGVQSCIVGRDLWNVNNGDCRTVRDW
ncbi:MAG: hypothetical protein AAF590_03210 [Pseudomonadota bacterium]